MGVRVGGFISPGVGWEGDPRQRAAGWCLDRDRAALEGCPRPTGKETRRPASVETEAKGLGWE